MRGRTCNLKREGTEIRSGKLSAQIIIRNWELRIGNWKLFNFWVLYFRNFDAFKKMDTVKEILKKYWGYETFRPLQEEIIRSVVEGHDTLALLPTGGGKSVCFQVAGLYMDGICVVISPLIALMKEQVEGLRAKGIKAVAITSAMHKREIDIALDNCVYGDVRFLYMSPERLESEIVKVRLQRMKVNLIAVDEAHCISQWGYDFRPSYLKIAELRELLPNVTVLALTATATVEVVEEIEEKLLFKNGSVFQQSYERKNLAYVVLREEDKLKRLLKIATNVKGVGIVYVRNRRKTQEIASYLLSNGIGADFYHAGLDGPTRDRKQNEWTGNKTRVMVCTNAFGMGIDKADVRFVVHMDVPDSVEAYFQEAGRAGRDGRKAFAVLLYNEGDKVELNAAIEASYPSIEEIKQTYQALANYYQVATGAGLGVTFDFEISDFCDRYKLEPIRVFNCMKFIEREGYVALTDSFHQSSRVKIELNKEELYRFQVANKMYDAFIKLLLRSYTGFFDSFAKINEYELAKNGKTKVESIVTRLEYLHQNKIITYIPQTNLPQLTFTQERVDAKYLSLKKENFEVLKARAVKRMEWMVDYAESTHECRSKRLLAYFGETESYRCNICDVCLAENRKILHTEEFENISTQIKEWLALHPLELKELAAKITGTNDDKILHTIRVMIDTKMITHDGEGRLCLVVKK